MEYCNGMMYAVKSGDTLYSISMKYNIPLAILLRANPYVDVYNLQVGETICLPMRKEHSCGEQGNERSIWERGETAEEVVMESDGENMRDTRPITTMTEGEAAPATASNDLQGTAENAGMGENFQAVQENPGMGQPMNRKEARDRDNMQWERYVTQPGDTLDVVLGGVDGMQDDDWEDIIEDFVEKNGMNRIYLLPGIVYYRQR